MTQVAPSIEVAWVSGLLIFIIYLFSFEIVSVDVAAVLILVILGLSSLFASSVGLQQGLVPGEHLFDGFSSNAVMSIIAVMIIGAGLNKTGVMSQVAGFILKVGGTTEARIIPIISGKRWLQWIQIERGDFHSSLRIIADRLQKQRHAQPLLRGAYG